MPCVALSHQCAVLHPAAPGPTAEDPAGRAVLKHYAPSTAQYGFHFQAYAPEHFHARHPAAGAGADAPPTKAITPCICPHYDEETLVERLQLPQPEPRAGRCSASTAQRPAKYGNVQVWPVSGAAFLDSLARSAGVLCGAGFETPAEALYLGKKLLVMPMKQQYEQHCNAAALAKMGVPVLKNFKDKHLDKPRPVAAPRTKPCPVDYPDQTAAIIDQLLREQVHG